MKSMPMLLDENGIWHLVDLSIGKLAICCK